MTFNKKAWSVFLLLFVFGLSHVSFAADQKVAYIDIGKVFDEYEKTKKFDNDLQEQGKVKQKERDEKVLAIRKLKDEQAILSDEKKKEAEVNIERKLKELDEFDQNARGELNEKRDKVVKEIFQDIDGLLQQYGERKGYDFIYNDRALVYRNPKYDQTNEVLKELNESYKKKK